MYRTINCYLFYRLRAYDRNSNFGQSRALEPEFRLQHPDIESYKDLHADVNIPKVSVANVTTFLAPFNKVIDKACKDLYDSGFVNY
jgi:hypothetical protein